MPTADKLRKAVQDYPSQDYPEEFYTCQLKTLSEAPMVDEAVRQAVKYLFLWKLQKVKKHRTNSCAPLDFRDSEGCQYYGIRSTGDNESAILRAIDQSRLEHALSFRDGSLTYEEFKDHAGNLTTTSIVLPAFYVHVWRPSEYPILDVNVWKVFCAEAGRTVSKNTKPRSWQHYEDYRAFFSALVKDSGLNWRDVDRALWVLGGNSEETSLTGCRGRH